MSNLAEHPRLVNRRCMVVSQSTLPRGLRYNVENQVILSFQYTEHLQYIDDIRTFDSRTYAEVKIRTWVNYSVLSDL